MTAHRLEHFLPPASGTVEDTLEVGRNDALVEVRLEHQGRTCSGFVTAVRESAGVGQALVHFFSLARDETTPRRLSAWFRYDEITPVDPPATTVRRI
jgi:hypothetical protein